MLAALLSAFAVVIVYLAAFIRWLRHESRRDLIVLAVMCLVAAVLRTIYMGYYPLGLHEDESRGFVDAVQALRGGNWFILGSTGIAVLPGVLFKAPLLPVLGPTVWAIRGYSLVSSVLSVPLAYVLSRALHLGRPGALVCAALVTTMPWAIYHGRIDLGGEMVFNELMLAIALARFVSGVGGWPEVIFGALGLAMMLYDYHAGRLMLALPVVAAILARGRGRWLSLATLVLGAGAFLPYALYAPHGFSSPNIAFHDQLWTNPIPTLWSNTLKALWSFVVPSNWTMPVMSILHGAYHPPLVIAAAMLGLGVLAQRARRVALFLLGGFWVGLSGTILSTAYGPSSHRMMMSYVFVVVAAAAAFELIRRDSRRWAFAAIFMLVTGAQGVHTYFADEMWPDSYSEEGDSSLLVQKLPLPPHPPMIMTSQLGYHFQPRALIDGNVVEMNVENYFPASNSASIYAFHGMFRRLRPFYEGLVGKDRVDGMRWAFAATFDRADWSWMTRHGWSYSVECEGDSRAAQVPTLFHESLGFEWVTCRTPIRHRWRARWEAADTVGRFRFWYDGAVTTSSGYTFAPAQYDEMHEIQFAIRRGEELLLEMISPAPINRPKAMLLLGEDEGVLPPWDSVTPLMESRDDATGQ